MWQQGASSRLRRYRAGSARPKCRRAELNDKTRLVACTRATSGTDVPMKCEACSRRATEQLALTSNRTWFGSLWVSRPEPALPRLERRQVAVRLIDPFHRTSHPLIVAG